MVWYEPDYEDEFYCKEKAESLAEKCVEKCDHGGSEESLNFACESCIYDIIKEARDNE